MARTENKNEITQFVVTDENTPNIYTMVDAVDLLDKLEVEAAENVQALALELGYEGSLSKRELILGIKSSMRSSIEHVLEAGRRLLILKEMTPHGQFTNELGKEGIDERVARKFMAATLKFSKRPSTAVLKSVGNPTKMLELLILDDGEVEALEKGDTVRGVTMDDIERMSASELRKALREYKERIEDKDKVLQDKNATIDKQAEKLISLEGRQRLKPVSAEQAVLDARANLQTCAAHIKAAVMASLRKGIKDLSELPGDHSAFAGGCLIEIGRELAILRSDFSLPATVSEDLTPEWMREDVMASIEKQYAASPNVTDSLREKE